jgi:hypothetical protein
MGFLPVILMGVYRCKLNEYRRQVKAKVSSTSTGSLFRRFEKCSDALCEVQTRVLCFWCFSCLMLTCVGVSVRI